MSVFAVAVKVSLVAFVSTVSPISSCVSSVVNLYCSSFLFTLELSNSVGVPLIDCYVGTGSALSCMILVGTNVFFVSPTFAFAGSINSTYITSYTMSCVPGSFCYCTF